jgi:hypothetical protein
MQHRPFNMGKIGWVSLLATFLLSVAANRASGQGQLGADAGDPAWPINAASAAVDLGVVDALSLLGNTQSSIESALGMQPGESAGMFPMFAWEASMTAPLSDLSVADGGAGSLKLNIFGEGEAPGFVDASTSAQFANGRPLTSGFANGSASDIFIRNAPITGENTIPEIMRLSEPGTHITLMQPASGFQGQALIDAFGNNASVNFIRTFPSQTVAPGVDMTIMRLTVGGH